MSLLGRLFGGATSKGNRYLERLFEESDRSPKPKWEIKPGELQAYGEIVSASPEIQLEIVRAAVEDLRERRSYSGDGYWHARMLPTVIANLMRRDLPYTEEYLYDLLRFLLFNWNEIGWSRPVKPILGAIERRYGAAVPESLRPRLKDILERLSGRHSSADDRATARRISTLLGGEPLRPVVEPSAAWARKVKEAVDAESDLPALLQFAATAKGAAPARKWLDEARARLDTYGHERFAAHFLDWTEGLLKESYLDRPLASDTNEDLLKGLLWMASRLAPEVGARRIAEVTRYAFRKIPGVGALLVKVGNAGLAALGRMPGLVGVNLLTELLQHALTGSGLTLQHHFPFDYVLPRARLL